MPSKEEMGHTFIILIEKFNLKHTTIKDVFALKDIVEKWLHSGHNVTNSDGEWNLDLATSPRFRTVESKVEIDDSFDANCVRFESVMEESLNPRVSSGQVLILDNTGIICRHPDSERLLVEVGFSERRFEGWRTPGLREKFLSEAIPVINSLKFTSLSYQK